MSVSALILIVSNTEEKELSDNLEQSGYAYRLCSNAEFSEKVIQDGAYDLVLKMTSSEDLKRGAPELEQFSNLSVPALIIGPNPIPAKLHSIPTDHSLLELQKRMGSLIRLHIMRRELERRSQTTNLYKFNKEDMEPVEVQQDEVNIMLIGQQSETLGAILLQLDSKSGVHICQNSDNAISELRENQFDAVIIIGVGQGDINLRLCNDIRADSRLFNLPVLFILENENNREASYIHGASDVVLNPDEMDNLFTRTALHIQQANYRFSLQKLFKSSKPLPVTDGPTALYSFGFMMAHMDALMRDYHAENKCLSVATINITNLSEINETRGYPAGDLVLRQVGSIVSFLVRGEDFCCHNKGGQFVIALPSTPEKDARIALNRVYGVIRNTEFAVAGSDNPVSAAVEMGLTEMQPNDTLNQMIDRGLRAKKLIG